MNNETTGRDASWWRSPATRWRPHVAVGERSMRHTAMPAARAAIVTAPGRPGLHGMAPRPRTHHRAGRCYLAVPFAWALSRIWPRCLGPFAVAFGEP